MIAEQDGMWQLCWIGTASLQRMPRYFRRYEGDLATAHDPLLYLVTHIGPTRPSK